MRGKKAPVRKITPDEIYGSEKVAKFINYIMQDGKKAVARKNVYTALEILAKDTETPALDAFIKAMTNISPTVEVKSRRVGGSNYQVPVPVPDNRQFTLASRWIIEAARKNRGSKPFAFALARELTDAFNGEGNAIKKKEEVKKMAEANKAFAQYA